MISPATSTGTARIGRDGLVSLKALLDRLRTLTPPVTAPATLGDDAATVSAAYGEALRRLDSGATTDEVLSALFGGPTVEAADRLDAAAKTCS